MTSKHGLLVGWDRPVTGREGGSVELFSQFTNYLSKQQRDKKIDDFEPVLLEAHGGDLNGFVMIRGGADQLHGLRDTDEWRDFVAQGTYNLKSFCITEAALGEAFTDRMKRYSKVIVSK